MNWFELPDNLDDAKLLVVPLALTLCVALPILFFGNVRFAGVAPRGAHEWHIASERMAGIVALTYSAAFVFGRSSIAATVSFLAALVLLTAAGTSPRGRRMFARIAGSISLAVMALKALLFPAIA
jgi:hypothetical protein